VTDEDDELLAVRRGHHRQRAPGAGPAAADGEPDDAGQCRGRASIAQQAQD
jgi:hypothetical protein